MILHSRRILSLALSRNALREAVADTSDVRLTELLNPEVCDRQREAVL